MTPMHVPRFLFSFSTEFVVCRRIEISELDLENLKVSARGYGETPGEIYGDETATKSHGEEFHPDLDDQLPRHSGMDQKNYDLFFV